MSARYALYLAPPPDSALWRFGSRVLGRDADSGETILSFAPRGFSPEQWREATAEPRRYGFHGTLKAPFRLQPDRTPEELEAAVATLAMKCAPFDLGALRMSTLNAGAFGFVALTPEQPPRALGELERLAVRELELFRAPLSDAEIARRRPDRLSPRQREYLETWGYPFVFEEFRLHFTLSGLLEQPARVAAALEEALSREILVATCPVDAFVLFEQTNEADFRVWRRFPFPN